jgi:ClpP class serine protease
MKAIKLFFIIILLVLVVLLVHAEEASEDKTSVDTSDNDDRSDTKVAGESSDASGKTEDTSEKLESSKEENSPEVGEEIDTDEGSTLELNPEYIGDVSDGDDEYDEYDEDEEDEMEGDRAGMLASSKSVLNKALASSRKVPKKTVSFVKKNRIKITIVMAAFAFRREIGRFLINKVAPPVGIDPKTGKAIRKFQLKVDPTSVVKIIVFVDIMRQLQKAGRTPQKSPLMVALMLLGAKNPVMGTFISKMILHDNPSYIPPVEQHYTFERLNDLYTKDCLALKKAAEVKSTTRNPDLSLSSLPLLHQPAKTKEYNETVIILDLQNFESSVMGRFEMLRDEVSFLIHQHREKTIVPYGSRDKDGRNKTNEVEVLVLLESPGGGAAEFALAAEQILRLRNEPGIQVTICVDKVAASGGYMIACTASPGRLFAAPFAVVGSIGVIGQIVNVQKMLEGWGMRPMVFRGGKEKAPVGMIGEVGYRDMKKIQGYVDETHRAFKRHVAISRPRIAPYIEKLATGKIWLGYDALAVGLIDRIVTSDAYIGERIQNGARLLKLLKNPRRRSLFGSHSRAHIGAEGRLVHSLLSPLKDYALQALQDLSSSSVTLPAEEVQNLPPLRSRTGVGQLSTPADSI